MKPLPLIAMLLILGGLVLAITPTEKVPSPEPRPVPDQATQVIVKSFQEKLKDFPEESKQISIFYLSLADTIERDRGNVVKTTFDVKKIHERSGQLMFQRTGIDTKVVGLADTTNKILEQLIGLGDEQLDSAKLQTVVKAFSALAWAAEEN